MILLNPIPTTLPYSVKSEGKRRTDLHDAGDHPRSGSRVQNIGVFVAVHHDEAATIVLGRRRNFTVRGRWITTSPAPVAQILTMDPELGRI